MHLLAPAQPALICEAQEAPGQHVRQRVQQRMVHGAFFAARAERGLVGQCQQGCQGRRAAYSTR